MNRQLARVVAVLALLVAAMAPMLSASGLSSGLTVTQCLTSTSETVSGCTMPSSVVADLFERALSIAIAPNGETLYLASKAGVSWYSLDSTGAMTYDGCIDCDATTDPSNRPRINDDESVAVSPDGASLYISADVDGGVLERFTLGSDGTPTFASCLDYGGDGGKCVDGPDVGYASDTVLVSPDSSDVYLADGFTQVAISSAGTMSVAGCLVEADTTGCTTVPANVAGAVNAQRLAWAPDGSIYGTSNGTLTHYNVSGGLSLLSCATIYPEATYPSYAGCGTQLNQDDVSSFEGGSMLVSSDGNHMLVSDGYELVKFDLGSGATAPTFDSCYGLSGLAPAACTSFPAPMEGDFEAYQLVASGSTVYAGTADGIDTLSVDSSFTPTAAGCIGYSTVGSASCDVPDPANSLDTAFAMVLSPTLPRLYLPTDSDGDFATLDEVTTPGSSTANPVVTHTRLAASPQPALVSKSETLTAVVSAVDGSHPTGTVAFTAAGKPIAGCSAVDLTTTPPIHATCHHAFSKAANVALVASYAGNSSYDSSTGNLTLAVDKIATKTTLADKTKATKKGRVVTLTASVKAGSVNVPAGAVSFSRSGKTIPSCKAVAVKQGKAVCSLLLAHGHYAFAAGYSGTATYAGSTSAAKKVTVT